MPVQWTTTQNGLDTALRLLEERKQQTPREPHKNETL